MAKETRENACAVAMATAALAALSVSDFHCRGPEEAVNLDNLGMKKSRIGGKQYLDYLWELGELLVYNISGFGISVSLRYDCLYVVKIRRSSHPCANIRDVVK